MIDKYRQLSCQRSNPHKALWTYGVYMFLFLVFFFAHPFDLYYSVIYQTQGQLDIDRNIDQIESGSLGRRVALISLGCFAVVSLLRRRRNKLQVNGALGCFILFFLVWAFFSIAWSDDKLLTIRKVFVLGLLCLGALSVAERLSFKEIIGFAFFSGCLTLLLGVICEFVLGTFRSFASEYRFCGGLNPIYQACNCSMLIIAALALVRTTKRGRIFYLISVLVAVIFMVLTKSRGPTASMLVAVFIYWSLFTTKYRKAAFILLVAMTIIIMYLALGDNLFTYGYNAVLLGREDSSVSSLTGRVPLWRESLLYISRHPMLGYGYNSFWTPERSIEFSRATDTQVPDIHNAYILLILDLGVIGALAYSLILGLGTKKSFSLFKSSRNVGYAFSLSLLFFLAINIILLSNHLSPHIPSFIVMVILAKLGFVIKPAYVQVTATITRMGQQHLQAHNV